MLPPTLKGKREGVNVAPVSVEIKIWPLFGSQEFVYIPVALGKKSQTNTCNNVCIVYLPSKGDSAEQDQLQVHLLPSSSSAHYRRNQGEESMSRRNLVYRHHRYLFGRKQGPFNEEKSQKVSIVTKSKLTF